MHGGRAALALVAALASLVVTGCSAEQDVGAPPAAPSVRGAPPTTPAALPYALSRIGRDATLTPQQARSLVTALWPVREQANARNDIATTDAIETGAARAMDDAVSRDDLVVPGMSLRRARPASRIDVDVPRPHGWPLSFLAQVVSSVYAPNPAEGVLAGSPYVDLLVVTRASATDGWRVALDTGFQGSVPIPVSTDATGYAAAPPVPTTPAGRLLPALAAYWQHCAADGGPPTDAAFQSGYWTDQRCRVIGAVRNGHRDPHCGGCVVDRAYAADPALGEWDFAVRDVLLHCGTIRIASDYRPSGFLRRLRQDSQRRNWATQIPPGSYRSLHEVDLRSTCIEAGASPDAGLAVVGGDSATIAASGRR